jgi:trehalose-phosphatase
LDLDGTLAPIVAEPSAACVPHETREAVGRLAAAGWRIVVVSGRPRAEARRMIGNPRVAVYGGHGLEGLPASPDSRGALARLRRVATRVEGLLPDHPGARVERKPSGVAFHDRQVPNEALAAWRRALRARLDGSNLDGLECLAGRRVLELRPAGVHKGLVVAHVLGPRRSSRTDASIVAMGDDTTDEDMFRVLGSRGLSVRIGTSTRRSLARRRLPSPRAAGRFLRLLADG